MRNTGRLLNRKDIEILKEREEKKRKKRVEKEMEEQEKINPLESIEREKRAEIWFWCMHCEQCFQGKEALPYLDEGDRSMSGTGLIFYTCPNIWEKQNVRCDGSSIDWQSWESFRKQTKEIFGVEYSLIPEKGKTYPMYPGISEREKEETSKIRSYRGDFPDQELHELSHKGPKS